MAPLQSHLEYPRHPTGGDDRASDDPALASHRLRGVASSQQTGEVTMHPNEQLLRDGDEAQLRGDVEALSAIFTDDVIVHIPGRSSLAGDYKGKDQFLELFQRFLGRVPDYTFEPHAYFADDEHGVSLQRSHYRRGDETLDSNDTFVCHFRDGKISEFWLSSEDPYAVDEFLDSRR